MRLDDLNSSTRAREARRSDRLETQAPLGNTNVPRGRTRYVGNESLLVEGSQKVAGWLVVTGTLKVVGNFLLEGITTITGDVAITGKLLINGLAELTKALTVKSGGSITVEGANPIVLSQVAGAAQMQLGDAKLIGGTNGFALGVGTRVVYSSLDGVVLQGGLNTLSVSSASGTSVAGNLNVSGLVFNTGITSVTGTANMYSGSDGRLYKVTSAARFKVDAQLSEFPDALLDVPVKDWFDAGQLERGEDVRRIPGVIAEEVEAAGGELFVVYGDDGLIEGVAYDRFALARTSILARRMFAADEKIVTQQEQIDALQKQVNDLIELLTA